MPWAPLVWLRLCGVPALTLGTCIPSKPTCHMPCWPLHFSFVQNWVGAGGFSLGTCSCATAACEGPPATGSGFPDSSGLVHPQAFSPAHG
uniref:Secreted protein n=1 Tax=Rhinopithecus roxellana TaxID=61622 RepID=A0A2K6QB22_RHIRO